MKQDSDLSIFVHLLIQEVDILKYQTPLIYLKLIDDQFWIYLSKCLFIQGGGENKFTEEDFKMPDPVPKSQQMPADHNKQQRQVHT